MRLIALLIGLSLVSGCVRPVSGLSFIDLTEAASTGLRDYHNWVAADEDGFPNRICLAAVILEAKLADTVARGAGASAPIAGPIPGLTSVLGYSLTTTEDEAGVVTVPMHAIYPKTMPAELAKAKQAYEDFTETLRSVRAAETGGGDAVGENDLRLPKNVTPKDFAAASDLARELWTVRQGVHRMVRNSPDDLILGPGPLTIVHDYRLVRSANGAVDISLAGAAAGGASASRSVSGYNRLGLFFTLNESDNKMTCDEDSVSEKAREALKLPSPLVK